MVCDGGACTNFQERVNGRTERKADRARRRGARQLANATKTVPQMSRITPRWLTHLLQWVPVEAGIYRLNRVKDDAGSRSTAPIGTSASCRRPSSTTRSIPREYMLSAVNTVVDVHTRVSDLYSVPTTRSASSCA